MSVEVTPGRFLGHEGVGVIEAIGSDGTQAEYVRIPHADTSFYKCVLRDER